MIDAPNVRDWLNAISLVYWALALIGVVIAWKLASGRAAKIVSAVVVFGFFAYWPVSEIVETSMKRAEFDKRYAAASARFEERCKIAGDKIVRTVDDVEGIMVMKIRTRKDVGYGHEQYAPGAAFYRESTDQEYLTSFLWFEDRLDGRRGRLNTRRTSFPGYAFLDAVDSSDGKKYRYRMIEQPDRAFPDGVRLVPERTLSTEATPRYAVTFEDSYEPEDREHWIAISTIKIIDLRTNEEIAKHTRVAFDHGLGGRGGGRQPWAFAQFCPELGPIYAAQTRHFVDQVLKPKVR